jgi:hypothetical protein
MKNKKIKFELRDLYKGLVENVGPSNEVSWLQDGNLDSKRSHLVPFSSGARAYRFSEIRGSIQYFNLLRY